jgi:hypothetical protein
MLVAAAPLVLALLNFSATAWAKHDQVISGGSVAVRRSGQGGTMIEKESETTMSPSPRDEMNHHVADTRALTADKDLSFLGKGEIAVSGAIRCLCVAAWARPRRWLQDKAAELAAMRLLGSVCRLAMAPFHREHWFWLSVLLMQVSLLTFWNRNVMWMFLIVWFCECCCF